MALSCTNGAVKIVIGVTIMSCCAFFLFASYSYNIKTKDKTSISFPAMLNGHVHNGLSSDQFDGKYSNEESSHDELATSLKSDAKEETTPKPNQKTSNKEQHVQGLAIEAVASEFEPDSYISGAKRVPKKSGRLPIQRSRAPNWLKNDVDKMLHLATWNILHLEKIQFHPGVDKIVFDKDGNFKIQPTAKDHLAICTDQCAVLKSYREMYEVVAYHLDRVLGLNRALPAVARAFTGLGHLGARYEDGRARPLIWWHPSLIHGGEFQEDQNSFDLSWLGYQDLLKRRCWAGGSEPGPHDGCSVVHLEWARLAIFDFLLQVYDRLDRNCCGFEPTEQDKCLWDGRSAQCKDPDAPLMLVHILSSRTHPTRLVFLDNAGVPDRKEDNLDFRLLAGIDEAPRHAVEVLKSGRLGEMLLRSLQVDRVFWNTQDREQLTNYINTLERRGQILL